MDINVLLVFTTFTLIAVVVGVPVDDIAKKDCNGQDYYWDKSTKSCIMCIRCGKGYRPNVNCGYGNGEVVNCIECPENYYQSEEYYRGIRCHPCTSCSVLNKIKEKNCTRLSNAECGGCKLGYAHDPKLPFNVGCTSCEHLPENTPDCQRTIKPPTTIKPTTVSVSSQSTSQSHSSIKTVALTLIAPLSPTKMTTYENKAENSTSVKYKTDHSSPLTEVAKNHIGVHGSHVSKGTFAITITLILSAVLIYTVLKITLKKVRSNVAKSIDIKDIMEPSENKNDSEKRPTKKLDSIPEELVSNDSDSGEENPLLKRPQFQRSFSAPPSTGTPAVNGIHSGNNVAINLRKQSVRFQKPLVYKRKKKVEKTPDEDLMEKTLSICHDKLLSTVSPDIQRKMCMELNPDRYDCMVQNWKDLARGLNIASDVIDNFEKKLESVFTYMSCTYPDTTLKTFLDAVKKLNRPKVLRTLCTSLIEEHENTEPGLISL